MADRSHPFMQLLPMDLPNMRVCSWTRRCVSAKYALRPMNHMTARGLIYSKRVREVRCQDGEKSSNTIRECTLKDYSSSITNACERKSILLHRRHEQLSIITCNRLYTRNETPLLGNIGVEWENRHASSYSCKFRGRMLNEREPYVMRSRSINRVSVIIRI